MSNNNGDDIIAAGKLAAKLQTLAKQEAKAMAESAQRVRDRYAAKREKLASEYSPGARRIAGVEGADDDE